MEFDSGLLFLGYQRDLRTGFVKVFGQMATTTQQADSQRKRWEGGRLPLLKNWALPLWREGVREHNFAKLDGALDLFVPPLTPEPLTIAPTTHVPEFCVVIFTADATAVPPNASLIPPAASAVPWIWPVRI